MDDRIFPDESEALDLARLEKLRHAGQGIGRTLHLALALMQSGRRIDLTGIDRQVGILCAQSLDLPPVLGREMVPCLEQQIAALDQLQILIKSS